MNAFGSCKTCKFARQDKDQLTCVRFPPVANVLLIPQPPNALTRQQGLAAQTFGAWPMVEPDQWCGEWIGALKLS